MTGKRLLLTLSCITILAGCTGPRLEKCDLNGGIKAEFLQPAGPGPGSYWRIETDHSSGVIDGSAFSEVYNGHDFIATRWLSKKDRLDSPNSGQAIKIEGFIRITRDQLEVRLIRPSAAETRPLWLELPINGVYTHK